MTCNILKGPINYVNSKLLLSIRKYLALIFITTQYFCVNKFKIKVQVISSQRLDIWNISFFTLKFLKRKAADMITMKIMYFSEITWHFLRMAQQIIHCTMLYLHWWHFENLCRERKILFVFLQYKNCKNTHFYAESIKYMRKFGNCVVVNFLLHYDSHGNYD